LSGTSGSEQEIKGDEDGADLEDQFAEDFYVVLVNSSGAASLEPFEIRGEGWIVRRIESAIGIGLGRYPPARLLPDG